MLTIGAPTEASGTPAAMDQGISGAATTAVSSRAMAVSSRLGWASLHSWWVRMIASV